MPFYEYRHPKSGRVRTELRSVSECKEDFVDEKGVAWIRIMSATPTTFRFNDRTGFKGLDKKRGS